MIEGTSDPDRDGDTEGEPNYIPKDPAMQTALTPVWSTGSWSIAGPSPRHQDEGPTPSSCWSVQIYELHLQIGSFKP